MTDSDAPAATATPETPPAGASAPAAPASAPAAPAKAPDAPETGGRKPTGNAFLDGSRKFAAKLDGKLEASEKAAAAKVPAEGAETKAAAGETKDAAGDTKKAPDGAKPAEGDTAAKPGEPAKAAEPAKEPAKPGEKAPDGAAPALSLVSKDGKAVTIAWPEGAVLRVKGSGKIHTIDRPEKVIELVQKGLDYGPATSRLGERAAQSAQQLKASQDASQKVLLAVLFGDGTDDAETVREQLMPAMRKYLDPEYREGLAAKKELADVKANSAAEREAGATELAQAVMDDAEQHVTANLGSYEYLEPSDVPTLQLALHREYESRFNERLKGHLPGLRDGTVDHAEVQADCEQYARLVLNTEALDILMKKLNDSYASRLTKRGGAAPVKEPEPKPALPTPGAADAGAEGASGAAIAAHNGKTDQKLEQAAANRTLRGAGTPPSTAPGTKSTEGMSWEERRKLNSNRLRTLGAG